MSKNLWTIAGALLLMLLPEGAQAARKVRLMHEAIPSAAVLGAKVSVSYEDARPAKQGGEEPELIGKERGSGGGGIGGMLTATLGTAVLSGAKGTSHPDEVVPAWVSDGLRAAGYDAHVGVTEGEPRVHVKLNTLWADGMMGLKFTIALTAEVFPAGATEPAHSVFITDNVGQSTITFSNDAYEEGFIRVFRQLTPELLQAIAAEPFQAALPGGNTEALAAVAEAVETGTYLEGEQAGGGQAGGAEASASGKTSTLHFTEDELPGFCAGKWQDDVCYWSKGLPGGLVAGGVAVGMLIAGDQWSRKLAMDFAGDAGVPSTMWAYNTSAHIPLSAGSPDVGWVIQGYASETMYTYGVAGAMATFVVAVPGIVAAEAGADLRTIQFLNGVASASYFVPGVMLLNRFGTVWKPQWDAHQANGSDRWHHLFPGILNLAMGGAQIGVGAVSVLLGVLKVAEVLPVSPYDQGLIPSSNKRKLKNAELHLQDLTPAVGPTADGGLAFGLSGRF